jgi:putative SbcD/Mre11-related phosphoesterase
MSEPSLSLTLSPAGMGTVLGPESWELTPEGAAIHRGEQTALIADVHLGYEWARGAAGDCVPAHSLNEVLERLGRLLRRAAIATLVVAGDLVESPRPCRRTAADLRRLRDWLDPRGVSLLVLVGNHDRSLRAASLRASRAIPSLPATCAVAGWTIGHGHCPLVGDRTISGHFHPVFRIAGTSVPCFLAGPTRIVLPAFSANAAGCDVATARVPPEWLTQSLRCIVSTGDDLLDLGPLPDLRRWLRRLPP